ncbi:hypothetical protein BT69DRAFT_1281115 [Atractiella rhizophila]|nr:hypothetical protein BT69DRAFT_1281115 [Atractiella rhizophila]
MSLQRRLFSSTSLARQAPAAVPAGRYKRTKNASLGPVNVQRGDEATTFWKEKPGRKELGHLLARDVVKGQEGRLYLLEQADFSRLTSVVGIQKRMEYDFSFTSSPATVILHNTLQLLSLLPSNPPTPSPAYLIQGPAGIGKSYALLQASLKSLQTGWIVLYLPECFKTINSTSSYVYSPSKSIYLQPSLCQTLLRQLYGANQKALHEIPLDPKAAVVEGEKKETLGSLLKEQLRERAVMEDMSSALLEEEQEDPKALQPGEVLHRTMEVLSSQTQFPVLLALDGVNAIYKASKYVDPEDKPIDSWGLEVPRLLLDYLSGTRSFKRGVVLSSTSAHPTEFLSPIFPSSSTSSSPPTLRFRNITQKYYYELAKNLIPVVLKERLGESEARGVFEMWEALRGVRGATDELFLEKLMESDGNVKMFDRSLRDSLGL